MLVVSPDYSQGATAVSAVFVVGQLAVRNTADTAVARKTRYTVLLMNNSGKRLYLKHLRFFCPRALLDDWRLARNLLKASTITTSARADRSRALPQARDRLAPIVHRGP